MPVNPAFGRVKQNVPEQSHPGLTNPISKKRKFPINHNVYLPKESNGLQVLPLNI